MISRGLIDQILEAGIRAPSGENSQPWRFSVQGERVLLFNVPDADRSLYNFHQNGSLVSHGAVLTNIRIAAVQLGFKASVELFPDENKDDLIASIRFQEIPLQDMPSVNPLYEAIWKRVTNRKHYDQSPLLPFEKKELLAEKDVFGDLPGIRFVLIEDREKINRLASAASVNETMLVLNRNVHDFFFSHVRWTPEENNKQPNGFFLPTLELNPDQTKGFKLMRKWGFAKIFSKLGVAKQIGKDNEGSYKSASAMMAIAVEDATPRNLIYAGEAFERAWLTATKLGLSVQPCTGALFLAEGIPHENWGSFSEAQRNALLDAKRMIYDALGVNHHREHVAVLFRIGRSEPPSAQAARFPLEKFLTNSVDQVAVLNRRVVIEQILNDLQILRDDPSFENQYAINELIIFFRAVRTYRSYIRWVIRRAPRLDRTRLLELTDLPFPRWDRAMHEKLIEMETRDFPGLVAPLVNRLVEIIDKKQGHKPFIGLHLGGGGREVDRQVMNKLVARKYPGQIVLIGVDNSTMANTIAKENLRNVQASIVVYEIEKLTKAELEAILKKETMRHIIILARNNIFDLPEYFPPRYFDVVYHTLFKHHLTDSDKLKLDTTVIPLGKKLLEYDGYRTWGPIIPQTLTGWHHPVFLSAELFSNLRYFHKHQLTVSLNEKMSFNSRVGTYLFERDS